MLVAELQPLLRGDAGFVDQLSLQQRSAVPEHTDGSSQKPETRVCIPSLLLQHHSFLGDLHFSPTPYFLMSLRKSYHQKMLIHFVIWQMSEIHRRIRTAAKLKAISQTQRHSRACSLTQLLLLFMHGSVCKHAAGCCHPADEFRGFYVGPHAEN